MKAKVFFTILAVIWVVLYAMYVSGLEWKALFIMSIIIGWAAGDISHKIKKAVRLIREEKKIHARRVG